MSLVVVNSDHPCVCVYVGSVHTITLSDRGSVADGEIEIEDTNAGAYT